MPANLGWASTDFRILQASPSFGRAANRGDQFTMRFETMEKQPPTMSHKNGRTRTKWGLSLILGFAVAAVLVTGVWTGVWLFPQLTPSAVSGFTEVENQTLFPRLAARMDIVRYIEIEGYGHHFTLKITEGTWRLVERDGFPARRGVADTLIREIAGLKTTFISDQDDPSYAEYGVDDPSGSKSTAVRVTLRNHSQDRIANVVVGHMFSVPNTSGSTRSSFVRRNGDPRVWLVDDALQISPDPLDWMDRKIMDLPPDRVREVTIVPPEGEKLVIQRSTEGVLQVSQGQSQSVDVEGPWVLEAIVGALEDLRFDDVRSVDALAEAEKPAWHATVRTDGGLSYLVRLFSEANDVWAVFSAEAEDGPTRAGAAADTVEDRSVSPVVIAKARRFTARHDGWAYRLPVHAVERLMTRSGELATRAKNRTP